MGVIKRQGIKRTIVTYVGVALGFISTLFIYPLALETYGFIQFLIATATFLVPFATLGINSLTIRFFPDFQNEENGHHGLLGLLFSGTTISLVLFTILFYFFQLPFYKILETLNFDSLVFSENAFTILTLVLLLSFIDILLNYISNFKRVVVPEILNNLLIKITIPAIILLLFFNSIFNNIVKPAIIGMYAFILLSLFIYLHSLNQLKLKINFSFLEKPLLKKMAVFAAYGIFGSIGAVMAFRIDTIMVSSMIDLKTNGIYNIAFFIANAIAIPFASIIAIAGPIISSSWKENDMEEISSIYQKSSLTLLIAGVFLFLLAWLSLDDILKITGKYDELVLGKYVVLFLGIGKIIDMTTGINSHIIAYSKYFRFNLFAILFLAVINIMTNYMLIPKYQMVGAAMATALSLTLFNIIKFTFIWAKFKMQPLTWATAKILLIAGIVYLIVYFTPTTSIPIVNILIRSALITVLFIIPVLYFNISPDITQMVCQGRDRVLKTLKRK